VSKFTFLYPLFLISYYNKYYTLKIYKIWSSIIMNEDRRHFSGRERVALYLVQDGRCALCGVELESGWHADHVTPWSHGGATDVLNGQALCAPCNLKKGNKVMGIKLRAWQIEATNKYYLDDKRDWLAKVTPGGGKTMFALSIAKAMLHDRTVERVIIVVPTDGLREQWSKTASEKMDLQLGTNSNGEGVLSKSGYDGQVVTYAQVASLPEEYRHACGRYRVLIVFDECHHSGDNQSWGKAMEIAFSIAAKRLSMTGTPWRAPRRGKIPFVTYDADGTLIANYDYGYEQAIADGVCRGVQFHAFDGKVTYVSLDNSSCVPMTADVQLSEVDEEDNSQVLRDILKADGTWMSSILRQAIATLNDIRAGDNGEGAIPDAKGLVVVHDRSEARIVAKLIERMIYQRPALIISDPDDGEPDPKEELNRFRTNAQVWAVAVDMVSEGVDIPALCVGVYATRKKTPLRFQQIIGRFIRMRQDEILTAIVFIPAVPSLLALASAIEDQLNHSIQEEELEQKERQKRENSGESGEDEDESPQFFVKDTSEAEFSYTIYHSEQFSESEITQAKASCVTHGVPARYAVEVAKILRANAPVSDTESHGISSKKPEDLPMSRQEEENFLRELLNKEIHRTAGKTCERTGIDIGVETRNLNKKVWAWYDKPRKKMSVEELRDARRRVKSLGDDGKSGA
jgi:superfamily II DNA or RNA helicase